MAATHWHSFVFSIADMNVVSIRQYNTQIGFAHGKRRLYKKGVGQSFPYNEEHGSTDVGSSMENSLLKPGTLFREKNNALHREVPSRYAAMLL